MDPSGKFIFIADTSVLAFTPAIIVYNVEEGRSYRLFSGQQFLYGASVMLRINSSSSAAATCKGDEQQCLLSGEITQSKYTFVADFYPLHHLLFCSNLHTAKRNIGAVHDIRFGPLGMKIHVDSIALDRSGSVLYFGALTGNLLLSISTSHLLYFTRTFLP